MIESVNSISFFAEYHGHAVRDLDVAERVLRHRGEEALGAGQKSTVPLEDSLTDDFSSGQDDGRHLIYLVGDSTMDNKHWLYTQPKLSASALDKTAAYAADACNGFERFLRPPRMVKDVAYWVNRAIEDDESSLRSARFACLNAAVEESTLSERLASGRAACSSAASCASRQSGTDCQRLRLLPQDCFVQSRLRSDDVLVVSVGGNDIALRPGFCTVVSILCALAMASTFGTTRSGYALGLGHFVALFGRETAEYVEALVARKRPKLVVVCMLYHLDQNPQAESWANWILKMLRYNTKPEILKGFIEYCFSNGTKHIAVEGCTVLPVPLFETLDGSRSEDYVARVEPSVSGGEKLGRVLWNAIKENYAG